MLNRSREKNSDIIYISHGGGPMPLLGDPSHRKMVDFLTDLGRNVAKPHEILVISAHWEEPVPTIYSAVEQEMLFDYYGFPPEAYQLRYPMPSNGELVDLVTEELTKHGLDHRLDSSRGLDHGVYIPLMIMYPEGDIPVTQLSLIAGLDASVHIGLGRALASLKDRNLLVIGSGFSFHNMRGFSMTGSEEPDPTNDEFQDWLIRTCARSTDVGTSLKDLEHWDRAPGARYCHPREEHLLPLQVCAGLAGTSAEVLFDDYIAGKRSVAFHWKGSE